jgi:hypothetical protein
LKVSRVAHTTPAQFMPVRIPKPGRTRVSKYPMFDHKPKGCGFNCVENHGLRKITKWLMISYLIEFHFITSRVDHWNLIMAVLTLALDASSDDGKNMVASDVTEVIKSGSEVIKETQEIKETIENY